MILKYQIDINNDTIIVNLNRLTNQIYKLLPIREEGENWQKPLETIIIELAGMDRLFIGQQPAFFSLLCKLEGLFTLTATTDFQLYRRDIFECLSLIGDIIKICQD